MSIVTKTGDEGLTDGPTGRISKMSIFPWVVGTLDELNAQIGVSIQSDIVGFNNSWEGFQLFTQVQNRLLDIGSELYTETLRITQDDLDPLEDYIERREPILKTFILPRGNWHLARAVCRRAERILIEFSQEDTSFVNPLSIKYLNRLSDTLFVAGTDGLFLIPWEPKVTEQALEARRDVLAGTKVAAS